MLGQEVGYTDRPRLAKCSPIIELPLTSSKVQLYTLSMTQTMTPGDIIPAHDVRDDAKLTELTASMREQGWQGAPVVISREGFGDQALTGSHRIAAAEAAEIDVPVVEIRDLMADNGQDFDALAAELGGWYEVAVRLGYYLPADVTAYYGLDMH